LIDFLNFFLPVSLAVDLNRGSVCFARRNSCKKFSVCQTKQPKSNVEYEYEYELEVEFELELEYHSAHPGTIQIQHIIFLH